MNMKMRRTMAEAEAMVERRKTSQVSVEAFCASEGISPANYYYWLKRLRLNKNPETHRIVPVCIERTVQHPVTLNENLELTYPNGVRLSVPRGCKLNLIRELVFIL
jgi:transposase-like protein